MKDIISNPSKYIFSFLICGVLISFFFFFFILSTEDRDFINGLTVFGTVFTFLGFIYALVQLANIRNTSIVLKEAIEVNQKSFNRIIILSNVSTAISKISIIQDYLKYDLNITLLKMKDLKLLLLEIKAQKNIIENAALEVFQKLFEDYCVDVKNLDDHLRNNSQITLQTISSNLEDLITILKQSEVNLKITIQKEL